MNANVYTDLVEALNEVEEYQKGNVILKSNVIDAPEPNIMKAYIIL